MEVTGFFGFALYRTGMTHVIHGANERLTSGDGKDGEWTADTPAGAGPGAARQAQARPG